MPANFALHQRPNSVVGLKTMSGHGGLRVAPKRGAFVDVTNTAQSVAGNRQQNSIKGAIVSSAVAKEHIHQDGLVPANPMSDGQAQTEKTRGTCVPIVTGDISNNIVTGQSADRLSDRPIAAAKPMNLHRAAAVYSDPAPISATSSAAISEVAERRARGEGLELKKLRHYKSQPLIKHEQPKLRRTQSRHLQLGVSRDDATAAVYIDALEQPLQDVDAAEYIRQQHQEEVDLAAARNDSVHVLAEAQLIEAKLEKELPAPPLLPAGEEYWDEEEDEVYDDQGYTTAHSYRSHGDNTTGGITTMLAPKVTAKVRRELDVAKAIVEENRSPDELEEETWDVSMVAEYGDEIFEYMRELEVRQCHGNPPPSYEECTSNPIQAKMLPNGHYMDIQTEIQWSMRSVLMDWLVQVHNRFSLLPETLFLTVNYIDRFLSVKIVSLGKLQLVGATAIFVAAKYEEINCPSIKEIVYMVDSGYTMDEILKAERFMLSLLGFELGWPGPMSFLRRISKADDYDLETRTLAKYFLEVTVMDERFVGSPPSFVAAGAHCLSRLLLKKGDWVG
jgi:G2/mitotic-specific cyclin 3/4